MPSVKKNMSVWNEFACRVSNMMVRNDCVCRNCAL
nr:MAG TPA: WWamide peptide [Caudoviricetes sp.]